MKISLPHVIKKTKNAFFCCQVEINLCLAKNGGQPIVFLGRKIALDDKVNSLGYVFSCAFAGKGALKHQTNYTVYIMQFINDLQCR